jgi:hypothetical protein
MCTHWGSSCSKFKSMIFDSVVPAFGVKLNPDISDISIQCLSVKAGLHIIPMIGI